METHTPNLARLEKRGGGKETWQATPGSFVWRLRPGANELTVRSVNHRSKTGREARVRVEWRP